MNRRRTLLSYLANSFSWELYSKTYFYNELVPTTINGKNVLNKAKIVKISGNGVIENQLVKISNIPSTNARNGVTFTKNDDGSLTISGTATSTFDKVICASVSLTNGHKYLSITYSGSANYLGNWVSGVASGETYNKGLLFTTTNNGNVSLYMTFYSGKQYNFTFYPQITDLTHEFGTGNEPTTLTDNRIQNILNRGYIPYNLGKYKESDIGVVSSYIYPLQLLGAKSLLTYSGSREITTAGSYALLYKNFGSGTGVEFSAFTNIQLTHKFFSYAEIEYNASNTLTNIHFAAQGTVASTYVVESHSKICSVVQPTNISVSMYLYGTLQSTISLGKHFLIDLTELGIDTLTAQQVYNLLNDTIISKLANGDTLNDALDTITFKAQLGGAINSHNTMEITNSAYVFTRNVWKYTFTGNENFAGSFAYFNTNTTGYYGAYFSLNTAKLSANKIGIYPFEFTGSPSTNKNLFWNNPTTQNIGISLNVSLLGLTTGNLTNNECLQALKTYLSNNKVSFAYELATPQVITIPRKHLGIVDLGSLNWAISNGTIGYVIAQLSNIKLSNSYAQGIYCDNYKSFSNYGEFTNGDKGIFKYANEDYIRIKDSSFIGKTINEIQALLSGKYLFYETENEVADITDTIDIESGGTITSNWFSWVENQLVQNGNFSDGTNNWATAGTLSVSNNIAHWTSNQQYGNIRQQINGTIVSGHKYLFSCLIKNTSSELSIFIQDANVSGSRKYAFDNNTIATHSTLGLAYTFVTPSATTNNYWLYFQDNRATIDEIQLSNVMLIDLTIAELEDATSINDPRIQEIIRLGYIPTNTTGTYKEVSPVVLPNIELSVKCK